jgi:hypothetical protein
LASILLSDDGIEVGSGLDLRQTAVDPNFAQNELNGSCFVVLVCATGRFEGCVCMTKFKQALSDASPRDVWRVKAYLFVYMMLIFYGVHAQAQDKPCETWAIVTQDAKGSGKVVACSRLLRDVPALSAAVDRLNSATIAHADRQRELERFVRSLGAAGQQLSPKNVALLARSIAEQINRGAGQSDERMLRELERLRIDMDDVRDKVSDAQTKKESAQRVSAAMQGDAGEAIARLDFKAAQSILDKLSDTGAYASNAVLLAQVRKDADQAMRQLASVNATERCPRGMAELTALRSSAVAAELRGQLNTAGAGYSDVHDRAVFIFSELSSRTAMAGMYQSNFENMRQTANTLRRLLQKQIRTPQQADELAQMDKHLADSDVLAQSGQYVQALNRLGDALAIPPRINPNIPRTVVPKQTENDAYPGSMCTP